MVFITPCHNEEGRVGRVVQSLRRLFPAAETVVVDDCSTDASAEEAKSAGATVLPLVCNLGYGAALQTGYMYAMRSGFDILVQLDADGQHTVESIRDLIAPVVEGKADLALGSRHLASQSSPTPAIRRLGHRVFSLALRAFGGPGLSDPTSGFQAMNARAVQLFSDDVFPCDYPDSDVMLMAHYAGLRIIEVPVVMLARAGGKSIHSGLKPLYYGIKMLFSMIIVFLNRNSWKELGRKLRPVPGPSRSEDSTNAA
jgi:hypothetical protein